MRVVDAAPWSAQVEDMDMEVGVWMGVGSLLGSPTPVSHLMERFVIRPGSDCRPSSPTRSNNNQV